MKLQILLIGLLLLSGCVNYSTETIEEGILSGNANLTLNLTNTFFISIDCTNTKVYLEYPNESFETTLKDICDIFREIQFGDSE